MHRGSLYYMFAAKFGERMNLPNKMAMGKVSPGTESCGVRGASFGAGAEEWIIIFFFFFPSLGAQAVLESRASSIGLQWYV